MKVYDGLKLFIIYSPGSTDEGTGAAVASTTFSTFPGTILHSITSFGAWGSDFWSGAGTADVIDSGSAGVAIGIGVEAGNPSMPFEVGFTGIPAWAGTTKSFGFSGVRESG